MFFQIAHGCQNGLFAAKRLILGPHRVRRTQLYGVGIGKSGTHSLASLFSGNVRARHEPEAGQLIDKILDWRAGRVTDQQVTAWIHERDKRLALEIDSSGLNFQIVEILYANFPTRVLC
jgi:hypothetical protein